MATIKDQTNASGESPNAALEKLTKYLRSMPNMYFDNEFHSPSSHFLGLHPKLTFLDFDSCADNLAAILTYFDDPSAFEFMKRLLLVEEEGIMDGRFSKVTLLIAYRFPDGLEYYHYKFCKSSLQIRCNPHTSYFTIKEVILDGATNGTTFQDIFLSGDIESNPGPVHSKIEDPALIHQMRLMEKEIYKLKKKQEKTKNNVQRQLDLEKRKRSKNRKDLGVAKRHAQGLLSFANNAGKAADVIAHGVGPTMDMAQKALQTLIDAGDSLRDTFKVPANYDFISILISMFSIGQAIIDKQIFSLSLHAVQLARLLEIPFPKLMSLIPSQKEEGIVYESEDCETPVRVSQSLVSDLFNTVKSSPQLLPFAGFLTFICGIFSFLCSGSFPSPSDMAKHFAVVGRASHGFRAIRDLFSWICDYIAEIYYSKVYGLTKEEFQFMQNFPQLENIYAASKIVEHLDKPTIDSSAAISNQILAINHQLSEYAYQAAKMHSRANQSLVQTLQKRMREAVEWATHSPSRCHTIRVEPIALYCYGHPGVGKTVLTDVLRARIFKHYLKEKGTQFECCSFPRRAKNEYWEGYTNQPIVILDDFGNVKDSQMKPVEEYEELEYMVNTAQFPLKMAELKSKGVSNFTSEFIIASSNQLFPDIKHLTDPGAVYRRFHIWAEITIDPAYGVTIGKDAAGLPYYSFDVDTVAKLKGCSVEDLDPLMTEHYRISLYKVNYNKQTGHGEVTRISGCQGISFDDYWKYIVNCNDKKKKTGTRLANAIRAVAGIEAPSAPTTEAVIMEQFDKIFSPDRFLEAVAEAEQDRDVFMETYVDLPPEKEPLPEEETPPVPIIKEEDSLFGSFASFISKKTRLQDLKIKFNQYKHECNLQMTSFFSKLAEFATVAASKFISLAKFIFSVLRNFASKTYSYLPSVPTSTLVTSICATIVAIVGVWYTGMFRSNSSDDSDTLCQFTCAPTNNLTPCSLCPACEILQFPKTGCMLAHFLERTGIKAVRRALYAIGYKQESLEDEREEIRLELSKEKPVAQALIGKCPILQLANSDFTATTYEEALQVIGGLCWMSCKLCENTRNMTYDPMDNNDCIRCANEILDRFRTSQAQRVYNHQPAPARQTAFAQRIYNNQPTPPQQARFAQGFVDCKTEMHIGARKYAQRDRVQIEQTTQTLLNNSVWIQAVDKNNTASRSNGVFLVGRTMITTAHTVLSPPHVDPIVKLVIRNPYSIVPAIEVPYDQCKVSKVFQLDGAPTDLALVSFPAVVPNRPKILSKFLDAKSIDLLKEGDLTFSGFCEVAGRTIVQEMYPNSFSVSSKNTEYFLHKRGECPKSILDCCCPIKIGNHIEYDLETRSGMCGALLSISNRLIHTKLIGFHVAGGAGVLALGALTTKQLLEAALDKHISQYDIPSSYLIDGRLPYSQSLVDPRTTAKLIHAGDCISLGTAVSPSAPVRTQLAKSLIFDKIQEHITKPAYLSPVLVDDEMVDPMEKGIKKIMGQQFWVNPRYLEAAANDVFQALGLPSTGTGIVHSYADAIRGVEGDSYKRPINRSTSPGYPYNLYNPMKGKTKWLGDGEEYIVDNPELKLDVTKLIEESRLGIRGSAISIATLKDEKRPIEKVNAGKTRVFEACPQHLVIAIRQYFLDFAAHVMRNRIDNGIAVGINPYSLEWTKVAHRLLEKGDHMIAGDFSNFDGSLSMQILVKICEKINEWYNDDDDSQLIRSSLWEHICNADVLIRGDVIRQTHSQPSGNPLTVIINSLFNGIAMRVAYLTLKERQNLPMVCDYSKYVNDIIYGDDDIKSVHIEILPWFNQIAITEALASFGLTYTDETKSGVIKPWKPLDETAFLKRKFNLQDDGTYMAPMDLPNVLEMTNWIKGKARRASTIENCGSTIMELALHPQKVYAYWGKRVREECSRVGINLIVPTWYEQMEEYRFNRDSYARSEYVPLW
jgi:V8-like Glu-specific endopeptidase